MNDKWMNDIRNRMADRKRKAPAGLLGDIKKEMDRRGLVTPVRPSGSAPAVGTWAKRIAVAAAVVVLAGAGWLWQRSEQSAPTTVATTNGPARDDVRTVQRITPGGQELSSVPPEPMLRAERKHGAPIWAIQATSAATDVSSVRPLPVEGTEPDSAAPEVAGRQPRRAAEPVPQQPSRRQETRRPQRYGDRPQRTLAYGGPAKASAFTASLHYSGFTASKEQGRQGMALAAADPIGYYDKAMSSQAAKAYQTRREPFTTSSHYRQPVKMGVSVGYRLNDRWSLRAGVTYSYLSSELVRGNGQIEVKTHQQLHYVGVPVGASYTLWRGSHAHVYLSGGGEVEKLVRGRTVRSHSSGQPTVRADVKEQRPQLSANAAVGAEYSFLRHVSIYAEPGCSYYFDNKSSVDNIYKDKKLNLSLNVGLRLNIGR